jgi:murein peptide amidase A
MNRRQLLILGLAMLGGCVARPRATTDAPPLVKITQETIGQSVDGAAIRLWRFQPDPNPTGQVVLLFAAIHGDETTTAPVMTKLVDHLRANPRDVRADVYIVPVVNPDGLKIRRRANRRHVDLNRNFPASNWAPTPRGRFWNGDEPMSEPETVAIVDLMNRIKPDRILSLHSIRPPRHGNNFDGPARELAELMSGHNGYPVLESMGYPTPGSFGSWAGIDKNIATITLELSSRASVEQSWKENRQSMLAFIGGTGRE